MKFQRSSGILVHPTSLPGPFGSGDLGPAAYHFIDWLVVAGQKLWQMLPLGPVGYGNSPYMGLSAFAGNPLLIDLQDLVSKGWLKQDEVSSLPGFDQHRVDFLSVIQFRKEKLKRASEGFFTHGSASDGKTFEAFCREHSSWLNDYSLFMALNDKYDGALWSSWDHDVAHRKPAALKIAKAELANGIDYHKFTQWCFMRQWKTLKKYANEKGIQLVGDIPIFVAHHSSDVWSNPQDFYLDKDGNPTVVAGVPPDYFSETGQRWGNPLYRWNVMKKDKYSWWVERFRSAYNFVDILRIDHFRGFAGYWEIPATEKTAVKGKWVNGPGDDLFKAVEKKLGRLPIIAEDLGLITPDVLALRDKFHFPGMKVLQFAFAAGPDNGFLPHNYDSNSVVYTGTHDNDTTLGWFKTASQREQAFLKGYSNTDGLEANWDLIRLALQSVAIFSIIPFQDVLGLGSEHRMNLPGTTSNNWEWRFSWDQVNHHHAVRLYEQSAFASRTPSDRLNLPVHDGRIG
jgi:4-alpha-glucanotransferase